MSSQWYQAAKYFGKINIGDHFFIYIGYTICALSGQCRLKPVDHTRCSNVNKCKYGYIMTEVSQ